MIPKKLLHYTFQGSSFDFLTNKVREVTEDVTYFLACPSFLLIPHINPDDLEKQSAIIHHKIVTTKQKQKNTFEALSN